MKIISNLLKKQWKQWKSPENYWKSHANHKKNNGKIKQIIRKIMKNYENHKKIIEK